MGTENTSAMFVSKAIFDNAARDLSGKRNRGSTYGPIPQV